MKSAIFGLVLVGGALVARTAHAEPVQIDLGGGVSLELASIPPGTFQQGSSPTDAGHQPDEGAREVRIDKVLWVGRRPVTRGQWRRFVEVTHYESEAERGTSGGSGWDGSKLVQKPEYDWSNPGFAQTDDDPVVLVTFGDALKFIDWVRPRATGLVVRLPTEAEWEYAAHGGKPGRFPWGDDPMAAEANAHFNLKGRGGTRPSGAAAGNAFGLLDMAGNVWQWTGDFYGPIPPAAAIDPAASTPVTWAHSDKPRRVLKGGSWLTSDRMKLRSAARNRATEGSRNADFGFRLVAERGASAAFTPPPASTPTPNEASKKPEAPRSGGGMGFGELLAIAIPISAVAFLIGWVTWVVRRGQRRSATGAREAPIGRSPYRTRPAADGFWIDAPRQQSGRSVSYQTRVSGRPVHGVAILSGSDAGTFVYTGSPPADVQLSAVDAAAEAEAVHAGFDAGQSAGIASSSYEPHATSFAPPSSSGSQGGWPSAY